MIDFARIKFVIVFEIYRFVIFSMGKNKSQFHEEGEQKRFVRL